MMEIIKDVLLGSLFLLAVIGFMPLLLRVSALRGFK